MLKNNYEKIRIINRKKIELKFDKQKKQFNYQKK